MLRTTLGQILVNDTLPEDLRDYGRVLDKKGMNDLLRRLAQQHPEKYADVSKKLNDIGRTVASDFGGYSFGLEHLKKSESSKLIQAKLRTQVQAILNDDSLTSKQRNAKIIQTAGAVQQQQIDDVFTEAVKNNNPLAMQVISGSRGNKVNLTSLLGSDLLYSDHRDEVIPLPVYSSYSEGLKPIEYWSSMYGARRGTIATKFATADAGFLSKQLNQVAHRLMVTDDDDPRDLPDRGYPVDVDDADNEGALLARDTGPYKRNTVLTPKMLKHIRSLGTERILVRSPAVGGSPEGGVYARDVGVRERGVLAGRGEQVGLTAVQALSEPLSQGQLSAKHSGGVAGQEKAVGGFAAINQLIQTPKKFKGGAAHTTNDGRVSSIEDAPAGGKYVWVDGTRHYVGAGYDLKVKKGDEVEAGDVLSEGMPNPSIVVQHKGVGEGRRYFVGAFVQSMRDGGMKVNRRNVELLSRGLINHVRLTDEFEGHVPDDVVPYSTVEHLYKPREDHAVLPPQRAVGQYLESPVLHYSVGTRIRPSVLKELAHFGVGSVAVHKDPPPFQPEMIRGMYSLQHDPDWMTRMYGSGLKSSLLDSVHRGGVSDEEGTSFVPGLSRAVDFGRIGNVRVPEPGKPLPPEGTPFLDAAPAKPRRPEAIDISTIKPPKKSGFFSGLFKASEDVDTEAARVLAEQAQLMKAATDPTHQSNTGSSTLKADGATPAPATKPPVAGVAPPPSTVTGQNRIASPAIPGQNGTAQPAAGLPPAAPPPPAPPPNPGRVDSGRMQTLTGDGYSPGGGLMNGTEDPEMMANFVAGGGDREQPETGYGGMPGAVTRFGSLLDSNAIATLTGGSPYAKNNYGRNPAAPGAAPGQGPFGYDEGDGSGAQPFQYQGEAVDQTQAAGEQQPAQPGGSWFNAAKDFLNPASTAASATGMSLMYRFGRNALAQTGLVSKAPGGLFGGLTARAAQAAPAAAKATGLLSGVKMLGKGLGKALGPAGWGLEVYEGANMSTDEARQQYNAKMTGQTNVALPFGINLRGDTVAGYLADNAVNPGRNVAALGQGVRDAKDEHQQAEYGAFNTAVKETVMLRKRLANPNLDPQTRAQTEARIGQIEATYDSALNRYSRANLTRAVDRQVAEQQDKDVQAANIARDDKLRAERDIAERKSYEAKGATIAADVKRLRETAGAAEAARPEYEKILDGAYDRITAKTGAGLVSQLNTEVETFVQTAQAYPELAERVEKDLRAMQGIFAYRDPATKAFTLPEHLQPLQASGLYNPETFSNSIEAAIARFKAKTPAPAASVPTPGPVPTPATAPTPSPGPTAPAVKSGAAVWAGLRPPRSGIGI